MTRKPIRNLRTGAVSRSLALARLGLGVGARAAGSALSGLLESEAVAAAKKQARWLAEAARLVEELGELKGSLMKAGQLLSVYGEHFLPPEISRLLRTLQSDSPPVEWSAIRKVLVQQLGKEKLARLEIDETPAGAASLGQVHKAVVRGSGEILALKIQYPGVDRAIEGDLKALRRILSLMEWLPALPAADQLFDEVRSMLRREVDYPLELEMLGFFGRQLEGDLRFLVPKPYPGFSTKRVLAMEFMEGVPIDGPEVAALSQERRNALSRAVLDLYFRELFEWRRVQTDPHFGNFRVRLGKGREPDRLILLDFGAIRDLPDPFLRDYHRMLEGTFHGRRSDFEKAAESLGVLAPGDPQELRDLFYRICLGITEPFLERQPYDWRASDLPQRLSKDGWELFRRFPLRAPPREVVFLDRKMAGVFTLLTKLGAKIDARAALKPYMG